MRVLLKLKKILLIGTIVLLGCDISLLFAAQNPPDTSEVNNAQLQAQIKALQNQQKQALQSGQLAAPPVPPPAPAGPLPPMPAQLPVNPAPAASVTVPPPVVKKLSNESNEADARAALSVTEKDLDETAYSAMLKNTFPMSPSQIQKLRSVYMASQYAATNSPGTPPRPTASSVFVDLSPGSTPPVVRLAQGFVSSLVFIDSTGAPWPIEAYDIGNPAAFNIQWDKTSNTLMIQSTVLYTYGNLAIKLKGLNIPVMLTLVPGQKAVDYRVDLRVQGSGPNARTSGTSHGLPASTSTDLLNVLDGIPPSGSKYLKVTGGNCQVWLSGSKMYVRTRLSVLSPGWIATLSSADGMHAYEMQPTPMLLVSQNGQVEQLKVTGF